MWTFEQFPAKLHFREDYTDHPLYETEDAPLYEVEVFGYICTLLIVYRKNSYQRKDVDNIGQIEILPIAEFEKRFKDFTLIQNEEYELGRKIGRSVSDFITDGEPTIHGDLRDKCESFGYHR